MLASVVNIVNGLSHSTNVHIHVHIHIICTIMCIKECGVYVHCFDLLLCDISVQCSYYLGAVLKWH